MKFTLPGMKQFEAHYDEHKARPFFADLIKFATSGPVCAMVWEGEDVIATSRYMIGATNPAVADVGSLRADYALSRRKNCVHASDSTESAAREISLWFNKEELVNYNRTMDQWIYEDVHATETTVQRKRVVK